MTFGSTTASEVGLVDLEDAVHPLEREHDAAVRRHRAAGVAGAGAARHDAARAVAAQQAHDRRDFLGAVPGATTTSAGVPRFSASVP